MKIIESKTTKIKSFIYFFLRNYAVLNILVAAVYISWKDKQKKDTHFGVEENLFNLSTRVSTKIIITYKNMPTSKEIKYKNKNNIIIKIIIENILNIQARKSSLRQMFWILEKTKISGEIFSKLITS